MDCIENCEVIDRFHDDELALRKELAEVKAGLKNSNQLCKDYNSMYQECKAERDRYLDTFMHTHVAGQDGDIDKCHKCGLDLRDPIHRRNDG